MFYFKKVETPKNKPKTEEIKLEDPKPSVSKVQDSSSSENQDGDKMPTVLNIDVCLFILLNLPYFSFSFSLKNTVIINENKKNKYFKVEKLTDMWDLLESWKDPVEV